MHAAVFHGPGNVRVEIVPDPDLVFDSDAIVRVVAAGLCGADLWPYRGYGGIVGQRMGHEFVGVVEAVGAEVRTLRAGDVVIAPPGWSDGTCEFCLAGLPSSCVDGGVWGEAEHDGAHGERVRVPQADGTLVVVPRELHDDIAGLLALTCIVPTGTHAAVSAGVSWGSTAVVLGDGAVGLAAVLACRKRGAEQIVAVGHHDDRLELATAFGATETVNARGGRAVEQIISLTAGAASVLECVGVQSSWSTAIDVARDGGRIGYVGSPHPVERLDLSSLFDRNVTIAGGVTPVRAYLPELLREAATGRLQAAAVVDLILPLGEIVAGYTAMDERLATKVLLTF